MATPSAYTHFKCNDNLGTTNVIDTGTGSNNGTANTNTSNLSTASGKINRAFDFTRASTEEINIDGVASNINTDSTGSFAFWLNVTNVTDSQVALGFGDNNDDTFFTIGAINSISGGSFQCLFLGNGGAAYDFIHRSTITTGWHHVFVIQDGVGLKVYVDNVDVTNFIISVDTSAWFATESGLYDNGRIGCSRYDATGSGAQSYSHYDGGIDDIRYYSNIVLTAEDRGNIYRGGTGTEDDPPPLWTPPTGSTQAVIIA